MNVKKFVKEHKEEFIAGAIGAIGTAVGVTLATVVIQKQVYAGFEAVTIGELPDGRAAIQFKNGRTHLYQKTGETK